MKVLNQIVQQWGNIDSKQLEELVLFFPNAELVIKWGMRERELCRAELIADRIAKVEAESDDYVREVFMHTKHFRMLKEVLGVK